MFWEVTIIFLIALWSIRGFKTDTKVSQRISLCFLFVFFEAHHINHILDWRAASLPLTCGAGPSVLLMNDKLRRWELIQIASRVGTADKQRVRGERDKWRQTCLSDWAHCLGCWSPTDNDGITLLISARRATPSACTYVSWPGWAGRRKSGQRLFSVMPTKSSRKWFFMYFRSFITLKPRFFMWQCGKKCVIGVDGVVYAALSAQNPQKVYFQYLSFIRVIIKSQTGM